MAVPAERSSPRRLRAVLALAALCAGASRGAAQQPRPVLPGERLRVTVTTPAPATVTGRYLSRSASVLQLQADTATSIPLAAIRTIEVSGGRKANLLGGVVGFVLGAGAGAALGCLANEDDYGVYCGGQDDGKVIGGAILGGAVGAAVGALLFKRERWSPVEPARLAPAP